MNYGERTSNSAIRHWFDTTSDSNLPQIKPSDLLAKTAEEKTLGARRLAYQIPEIKETNACARSFEDALVLANPKRFSLEESDNMASNAWDIAKELGKADTALQFAIREKNWAAPRYIREALAWLAEPSQVKHPAADSISPKVAS